MKKNSAFLEIGNNRFRYPVYAGNEMQMTYKMLKILKKHSGEEIGLASISHD